VLNGHVRTVFDAVFTPDGRRALTGSRDRTVRLWDVKTGECLRVLEGHTDDVYGVSFSPDGRRAFSGSVDNTARIWDLRASAY